MKALDLYKNALACGKKSQPLWRWNANASALLSRQAAWTKAIHFVDTAQKSRLLTASATTRTAIECLCTRLSLEIRREE